MFKVIVENIVKWGVNYLNKSEGKPSTEEFQKKIASAQEATQTLFQKQTEALLKRSDIIQEQKNLIDSVEPQYFRFIATHGDDQQKTTLTLLWSQHINKINSKINEHQVLMQQLNDAYFTVEQLNKEIGL